MRKFVVWLMLCVLLLVHVAGCQKSVDEQGRTVYKADPNKVKAGEEGAAGGVNLLGVLSVFYPALLPVSTAAAGVLGAWFKVRPKLNEYRTTNQLLRDGTFAFVEGIELLKKESPEQAKIVLDLIEGCKDKIISKKDRAKIEAIIRGLRGLPLKESVV
jgi:hypothetical protein